MALHISLTIKQTLVKYVALSSSPFTDGMAGGCSIEEVELVDDDLGLVDISQSQKEPDREKAR